MRPFLLLSTRPEDAAADGEYAAFRHFGGLGVNDLERIRLEAVNLPHLHLEDYSGIIVGGSPFTGSVPREYKSDTQLRVEAEIAWLLDRVVELDYPFLGACYGVGTLGRHQGGVIDFTYTEPISAARIQVTDDGAADPLLAGLPRVFDAYVGHKEACSRLPDNAVLLATSAACPVQMFRIKENLYGTQFHPELDYEWLVERIDIYRDAGYFDPEEIDEVKASTRGADVDAVHGIIRKFVERYAR